MHSTCAIWQCRPVNRGFIVGPKGSRPNRQKFLYLHSCVFITPLPPSRYVVRSMNLNCDLRSSLLRRNPLWKRSRTPFRRERSCHERNTVVKIWISKKNSTRLSCASLKIFIDGFGYPKKYPNMFLSLFYSYWAINIFLYFAGLNFFGKSISVDLYSR